MLVVLMVFEHPLVPNLTDGVGDVVAWDSDLGASAQSREHGKHTTIDVFGTFNGDACDLIGLRIVVVDIRKVVADSDLCHGVEAYHQKG